MLAKVLESASEDSGIVPWNTKIGICKSVQKENAGANWSYRRGQGETELAGESGEQELFNGRNPDGVVLILAEARLNRRRTMIFARARSG